MQSWRLPQQHGCSCGRQQHNVLLKLGYMLTCAAPHCSCLAAVAECSDVGFSRQIYEDAPDSQLGLLSQPYQAARPCSVLMAACQAHLLKAGHLHRFCGLKTPDTKLEAANHLACLNLRTCQLLVDHKLMRFAAEACLQMSGGREGCCSLHRWAQRGRSCIWAIEHS